MVSGSLCPTKFIKVESHVSLVVTGQWPHRGQSRGPQRLLRGAQRQLRGPERQLGGP